jgi:iron complex outermembrane receptor protein
MINAPHNMLNVALGYDDGSMWASVGASYKSSIWGDFMNTESVGGYTTLNLNAGYRFADFSDWFKKPYIKLNLTNITDRQALTFATNSATLAVKPPGSSFFTTAPTYSLLQPRAFMVTIGASFF